MKSGFVPGLLVGFVLATGAMGWFVASQKLFAPPPVVEDKPMVQRDQKQEYVYFAATADGRISKLVPMKEPNISSAAIRAWASVAVSESFNLPKVRNQERFYSTQGWQELQAYLQSKGLVAQIGGQEVFAASSASRAPIVLKQGVLDGVYRWQIAIPMVTTWVAPDSQKRSENHTVVLTVSRSTDVDSPDGIVIISVKPLPEGARLPH